MFAPGGGSVGYTPGTGGGAGAVSEFTQGADEARAAGYAVAHVLKVGSLSLVYLVYLALVVVFGLAFVLYVLGLGNAVFNVSNAYVTWTWWRIWGPAIFNAMVGAAKVYFLYQERKSTQSMGTSILGRGPIRLIYGAYVLYVIAIAIFTVICMLWMSIEDIANCGSSALCQGVELSATASRAIIFLQVGGYLMFMLEVIALAVSLYVHAASRDVHAANNSTYAQLGSPNSMPLNAQIGSSLSASARAARANF